MDIEQKVAAELDTGLTEAVGPLMRPMLVVIHSRAAFQIQKLR